MTALYPKHAFNVVPGEPQPSMAALIAQFFRRALRLVRGKQAPEGVASGATGTALILLANRNAAALGSSFRVSLTPDEEIAALAELGQGALGDRMLSDVRTRWNDWHDSTPVPTFTPALTPAQQSAHADAMHNLSARYLPPPPRPVNGRNLGTQPRRQPVYGEAPHLEVERAAYLADEAAEADRAAYVRSQMRGAVAARDPETLKQVLAGLKKKLGTDREATYLGGWQ